jgi:hypothetical protein
MIPATVTTPVRLPQRIACMRRPPTSSSARCRSARQFGQNDRLGAKTLRCLAARIDAGLAGDENDPVRSVDLDHLAMPRE